MDFVVGESKTTRAQKPTGDGGYVAEVTKGTPVFTVIHVKTQLEFAFAYVHRDMAKHVADKFSNDGLGGSELDANFHKRWISVSDRRP